MKKATPDQENSPSKQQPHDNSTAMQRTRLSNALDEVGPRGLSTIELREDYDIMSPAPRVLELRALGFQIETLWIVDENSQGNVHRCARYVLIRQAGSEL
ncbi:MAG: helix-turn-helix domain-containing protein [Pseudomonadales bacterium]|nr:helix-turn-helix domain-containing protein [Pseudomonadales bacterium]